MSKLLKAREISGEEIEGLTPGKFPVRAPLEGDYARLEPLDPQQHAAGLFQASHEGDDARRIWDFLPDGPFADLPSFTDWLQSYAVIADRLSFAVRDRISDKAAGMASYMNIHPRHGCIEIGYIWFAPFLQNTRQSAEALFRLMQYAFDGLGYRRLEWKCDARNEPSRRAALRLGFAFEGVFYQHLVVKGRNRDTAWYSMLDTEWPMIRENFEQWLSPENFDADGQQRLSLGVMNRALRNIGSF